MIVSLIVAMARNRVIGIGGRLPWHFSEDLKYFKRLTMSKPIIMGRKTFESIGKPLPGRVNIVVTRNQNYAAEGVTVVGSLQSAIAHVADFEEVFVIGGEEIFKLALPAAHRVYLTVIDAEFEGDTFFPHLPSDFKKIAENVVREKDTDLHFCLYERQSS